MSGGWSGFDASQSLGDFLEELRELVTAGQIGFVTLPLKSLL